MKKGIIGIVALTLMFATSCKKNSSSSNSWSFKGTTYNTVTCSNVIGILEAVTTNGTINIVFNNNAPTATTTYTIASGGTPSSNSQVGVTLTTGTSNQNTYSSTGGNGNQTLTVTVSGGKLSVSGQSVEMVNDTNASDSSAVNINIAQTN